MKNYYNILEVSESASKEVIEKAYKVLVRRYHPDLRGNDQKTEEKIREINEAYDVLSNDFLREQYDAELKEQRDNHFQESDYGRMYKEQQRLKYELAHEKYDKERISYQKREMQDELNRENNTSTNGIISIFQGILQSMFKMKNLKSIKKLDFIALGLTIIIVLTIGLVLYFLPFTHNWMTKNFFIMG